MAFAQQQRKKPLTSRYSESESSRREQALSSDDIPYSSDNDWHLISSRINRLSTPVSTASTNSTTTSPLLQPSESGSSYKSDTESYSDLDSQQQQQQQQQQTSFLPSHDGTGTFLIQDFSSDQNTSNGQSEVSEVSDEEEQRLDSPTLFKRAIHNLMLSATTTTDEEGERNMSDNSSVVDILLPHGGIRPPSFVTKLHQNDDIIKNRQQTAAEAAEAAVVEPPCFVPTTAGLINSHDLLTTDESISAFSATGDNKNIKFKSKTQRNLDSIPLHHPGIPETSALLSIVWNSLRRLTNHLVENDTNTAETLSNLMSEAALEGCMPFGNHLHMEIGNKYSSNNYNYNYNNSLLEGII